MYNRTGHPPQLLQQIRTTEKLLERTNKNELLEYT